MELDVDNLSTTTHLADFYSSVKRRRDRHRGSTSQDRVFNQIKRLEAAITKARTANFEWLADKADRQWCNGNPGRAWGILRRFGFTD